MPKKKIQSQFMAVVQADGVKTKLIGFYLFYMVLEGVLGNKLLFAK